MSTPSDQTEHIDVAYVAQLARLRLNDEETQQFQGQLDDILKYVSQLDDLNVEGVEPMAHAVDMSNVFREDVAGECMNRDDFLNNAPRHANEQVLVPRILE